MLVGTFCLMPMVGGSIEGIDYRQQISQQGFLLLAELDFLIGKVSGRSGHGFDGKVIEG
jgi:hypothetical protein